MAENTKNLTAYEVASRVWRALPHAGRVPLIEGDRKDGYKDGGANIEAFSEDEAFVDYRDHNYVYIWESDYDNHDPDEDDEGWDEDDDNEIPAGTNWLADNFALKAVQQLYPAFEIFFGYGEKNYIEMQVTRKKK